MKHTFFALFLSLLLIGCTSTPPPPPKPVGELTPVNPSVVYRSDLEN